MKDFLECGVIQNTHGVKGMLRVGHYCDNDEIFCALKTVYTCKNGEYKPLEISNSSPHGGVILCAFNGIEDIDTAIPLKGMTLYARREDIPVEDGAVLIADLIGMSVIDADSGELFGTVRDVFNRGASDIYVISDGSIEFMLPAVPEFVIAVDDKIHVRLIEGMRQ